MNSIAVFNNKGGVGKTTLLCNIAAYYRLICHKRVLVIDADPQCNATTYLLDDNKIEEVYSNETNKTLYDYIEPYQSGDNPIDIPILKSDGFGVDLVIGDTRLALMEDFLSGEWADTSKAIQRSIKTVCFLKKLYIDLREQYDFIFVDIGPSLGVLNRLILLFQMVLSCQLQVIFFVCVQSITSQKQLLNGRKPLINFKKSIMTLKNNFLV